jgi:hypothetical protein
LVLNQFFPHNYRTLIPSCLPPKIPPPIIERYATSPPIPAAQRVLPPPP